VENDAAKGMDQQGANREPFLRCNRIWFFQKSPKPRKSLEKRSIIFDHGFEIPRTLDQIGETARTRTAGFYDLTGDDLSADGQTIQNLFQHRSVNLRMSEEIGRELTQSLPFQLLAQTRPPLLGDAVCRQHNKRPAPVPPLFLPVIDFAVRERKASLPGFSELIRALPAMFTRAKPLFLHQAENAGPNQAIVHTERRQ
jgi:hypothetical protein